MLFVTDKRKTGTTPCFFSALVRLISFSVLLAISNNDFMNFLSIIIFTIIEKCQMSDI